MNKYHAVAVVAAIISVSVGCEKLFRYSPTATIEADAAVDAYVCPADEHPTLCGWSWTELAGSATAGGISKTPGDSQYPALAIDVAGNPIVAWQEKVSSDTSQIYVLQFDGQKWIELGVDSATNGGISTSVGEAVAPALVIAGRPVVAWQDNGSGVDQIYARAFDGTRWVAINGSDSPGTISKSTLSSKTPALAVSGGQPGVAWMEESAGVSNIMFKLFDDGDWVEWIGSASGGGVSNSSRRSTSPRIAVAINIYIAWNEEVGSSDTQIHMRRFEGSGWVNVSDGISAPLSRLLIGSLLIDAAAPIVAWHDDSPESPISLKRLDGVLWNDVGEGLADSGSGGPSRHPSVATDKSGRQSGRLAVVWAKQGDTSASSSEIYARLLVDSQWIEMPLGAASGGGISNGSGESNAPVLLFDAQGRAVVAWHDNSSDNFEIYVKRFEKRW